MRRATADARVAAAVDLVANADAAVVWCETNAEGDALERAIPGAIQVTGSQDPETKASLLADFAAGRARVLVTKPSIAGFGLNWQHCACVVFAGASHSYEQTYQAIRRCWRFGQRRTVTVHMLVTPSDRAVLGNLRRKEADAERMAAELSEHVIDAVRAEVVGASVREWNPYQPAVRMRVPAWLGKEAV